MQTKEFRSVHLNHLFEKSLRDDLAMNVVLHG